MTKRDQKLVNNLIHSTGLLLNLRDSEVLEIIESQFRFIYHTIHGLDLESKTAEEVDEMKTNFIIRHLGKFHTNGMKVENINKRKQLKNDDTN